MSATLFHQAMFVLAALCALLSVYGAVLFALGQWSRHWPATIGTIESAALKTARIANGPGAYWVAAEYAYCFGRARAGSWIGFAHPGTASNPKRTWSTANRLRAELVPGSRVDVFVCPAWP